MWSSAVRLLMAGALCAAAFAFPAQLPSGDTNGDQTIDVLDLQLVIAQVLNGERPLADADVTRDGVVDIRDYQELLNRAQSSEEEKSQTRRTDDRTTLLAAKQDTSSQRIEVKLAAVSAYILAAATEPATKPAQPATLPPIQAGIYVLNAFPHAPPLSA